MEKTELIWMDGKLVPWEEAKIHVLTHTLHYGGGVFEGIRCYNTDKGPAVFRLDDHAKRLMNSAKALKMKVPYDEKQIKNAIIETIKKNNLKECYIRPIIYHGYGVMGLKTEKAPVNIAIACWPWGKYLADNVKAKIVNIKRIHPATSNMAAKICAHYANSIMASQEATAENYDEAILLDHRGFVAEGPGENIFLVKTGMLITPRTETILPGITRDCIIKIAKENNIDVIEKDITPMELKQADEAFFTGTAAELTPIAQIDHISIKTGPITAKLKEEYKMCVQGKKHPEWMTYL